MESLISAGGSRVRRRPSCQLLWPARIPRFLTASLTVGAIPRRQESRSDGSVTGGSRRVLGEWCSDAAPARTLPRRWRPPSRSGGVREIGRVFGRLWLMSQWNQDGRRGPLGHCRSLKPWGDWLVRAELNLTVRRFEVESGVRFRDHLSPLEAPLLVTFAPSGVTGEHLDGVSAAHGPCRHTVRVRTCAERHHKKLELGRPGVGSSDDRDAAAPALLEASCRLARRWKGDRRRHPRPCTHPRHPIPSTFMVDKARQP